MKHWTGIILVGVAALISSCDENNTARLDNGSREQAAQNDPFDSINNVIKERPNDADLYFERAQMHYAERNVASSLADVGRALRLDSLNPDYYILMADLKLINKESRDSRDALLKAYAIDPTNVDVLLKLGELYMVVRDADASFKYLNEALKEDVYNATAYRLKGFNYKFLGDTLNAISSFQTAVEQDPEDYDAYMQLGLIYAEVGQPLAEDYFNNALKVRPQSIEALYAKGLFLQTQDQPREAISVYDNILAINQDYFEAWYNIGYVHLEMLQNFDSAAYNFNQAIATGPRDYFTAIYNRGLSREREGNLKQAAEDYRAALKINPQFDLAARGLSRVLGE
jgi:tetratricopeptide (TPR) repeat protein